MPIAAAARSGAATIKPTAARTASSARRSTALTVPSAGSRSAIGTGIAIGVCECEVGSIEVGRGHGAGVAARRVLHGPGEQEAEAALAAPQGHDALRAGAQPPQAPRRDVREPFQELGCRTDRRAPDRA